MSLSDVNCCICLSEFTLPVQLPSCKHVFCYLCIKGHLNGSSNCPLCRTPIPANVKFNELKKEDIKTNSNNLKSKIVRNEYVWLYKATTNGWWIFEKQLSYEIENKYLSNKNAKFDLLVAGNLYEIDLQIGYQIRKDDRTKRRRIKRIKEDSQEFDLCKGIAGMKI